MERQFVIHIHSGHGELHYDLMLSHGEDLATWQLPMAPTAMEVGESMEARKLANHRADYLTYEGPVSRNRGEVTALDRGSCQLLKDRPSRWEFVLDGDKITGRFELAHCGPEATVWVLRKLPDA